jgi:hypothetical protein
MIEDMALNTISVIAACLVASFQQTPPVPKPFPQPASGAPPATAKPDKPEELPAAPAAPAGTSAAPQGVPTADMLGAPIYPTAEFLESFDAGRGQRYYIFGTNAVYSEIVGYYKNVMRNGGRQIFEAPAMQQWELAKFRDEAMAFPPSVVVKDYTWNGSSGYLFVDGTKEKRYKTIIQIVPAPPGGGF